jgi:integrase
MSVYQRGKSWYINIRVAGERIHRKAGDTRADALEIQDALRKKARLLRFQLRKQGRFTFEQTALQFLKYTKDTKSNRTYTLYNDDYKNHLQSFFNLYYLDDVKNDTLLAFQSRQKRKGLNNRTVNIHMALIRQIMNFAIRSEYIGDPKLRYPMLRESKRLHAFFSPQEFEKLIKKVSGLVLKRIRFGRLTGLRPRELAFLSWTDIDIELAQLKIQAKPKSGFQIKTDEERIIPLSHEAIEILESIPRMGPWIFSPSKKPVVSIRRALKTAAKNAGIKKTVTPGMLRHTFATHSLMAGADIQAVQYIMGHKSLETTYQYTHALKESMKKAVELLSK